MSLLIRYSYIPFYFHFCITFSTSPIHNYTHTPLPTQPHATWLCLLMHDTCLHFIRPASLIWWTDVLQFTCFISILSSPNVCPPAAWLIMNPCAAQSGTYYSFTLDEPCAHFLVDHLYLACLYLSFPEEESIAYTSFPQFSDLVLAPHLTSHSPCPISHCIALPCSPTVFTCYTRAGDNPLPPDRTLRAS